MSVLRTLASVLLLAFSYSLGVTLATRRAGRARPRLIDLAIVLGMIVGMLITGEAVERWLAITAWLLAAGVVGYTLAPETHQRPDSTAGATPGAKGLWAAWKLLAADIGNFQSRLLLAAFYFLVLAPWALIVRTTRNPLRSDSNSPSGYWHARPDEPGELASLKEQH